MDGCQVPEHTLGLVAGIRRDGDSLMCLTNELLELLRHGDDVGAERSSVDEKLLPPPPAPAMATDISSSNQQKLSAAREAEMASWVRQVFEQDASDHELPRPATTEPGGGRSAAATGTSSAAANKAECCRGRRHGRPRSHAERAAEQRRRDKIHKNMRTLQQLVPWCKKTDKASTLEEVIHYVKFLQHQLQVLSNGFATQTAILPPEVVPPPCMQPAGDVFGVQPVIMLPQYKFVPAMFPCPHHGNDCAPLPAPAPLPLYHHQLVGISAMQQRLNHHRLPDLAMPSHRKADPRTTKMKREKAERSAWAKLNRFSDVI